MFVRCGLWRGRLHRGDRPNECPRLFVQGCGRSSRHRRPFHLASRLRPLGVAFGGGVFCAPWPLMMVFSLVAGVRGSGVVPRVARTIGCDRDSSVRRVFLCFYFHVRRPIAVIDADEFFLVFDKKWMNGGLALACGAGSISITDLGESREDEVRGHCWDADTGIAALDHILFRIPGGFLLRAYGVDCSSRGRTRYSWDCAWVLFWSRNRFMCVLMLLSRCTLVPVHPRRMPLSFYLLWSSHDLSRVSTRW